MVNSLQIDTDNLVDMGHSSSLHKAMDSHKAISHPQLVVMVLRLHVPSLKVTPPPANILVCVDSCLTILYIEGRLAKHSIF